MSDILGKEIEANDIVIYAKREGKKQMVGIGIVLDPNYLFGRGVKVKVVPLSSPHAKMGRFKVGYNLMSPGTPITHLNDSQIMVVPNIDALPKEMVEALQNAVLLRERALQSAEESRLANKKLTAGQRFNNFSVEKRKDDALLDDPDVQSILNKETI